jgi:hypothetical protein
LLIFILYKTIKKDETRDLLCHFSNTDRLLYGTDLADTGTNNGEELSKQIHETWLDDWKYFTSKDEMTSDKFKGKFEGLQLPKEVVNKIFSENAIKWYKLK